MNLFSYAYSYVRKDYPEWSERRVNSPLPPIALPGLFEKDMKPVNPIWLGSGGELRFESHVELPKGATSRRFPRTWMSARALPRYHRSFGFKNNILTAQRRFVVKLSEVPVGRLRGLQEIWQCSRRRLRRLMVPVALGTAARAVAKRVSERDLDLHFSQNADAIRAYDDARAKIATSDYQAIVSLKRGGSSGPQIYPRLALAWRNIQIQQAVRRRCPGLSQSDRN